jgi:anthranilate synthase component 2
LKIALVDFKDSFTYNVYHYLDSLGYTPVVFEDGVFDPEELTQFDGIILSPGPGLPSETKSMFPLLEKYAESKFILGICLGMQGITEFYRGKLYNQNSVQHGVITKVEILIEDPLFKGIDNGFEAGLYHSWACDVSGSIDLEAIAISSDNVLMAIKHKNLNVYGLQFHPESIMTLCGKTILENFINFITQK